MKIFRYILLILVSMSAVSCFYAFDLDFDDEPVIYLESFPGATDMVVFKIDPAYSYSNEASRPEFKPEIVFKVNGKEVPVALNTGHSISEKYFDGCYLADYKPVPGDKMSVEVSSEGFKTIYAETSIPEFFPQRKIDYRHEVIGDREFDVIYVSFDDDDETDLAYGLQVWRDTKTEIGDSSYVVQSSYAGQQLSYYYDMAPDTFEGRIIDIVEWMTDVPRKEIAVWSDEVFNGMDKTISMVVTTWSDRGTDSYESFFPLETELSVDREDISSYTVTTSHKLRLYTLSDEFYKYTVAQELIVDNASMFAGIAPSNYCYSNIKNGYGVFAGVTFVDTDYITREFIENNRR